MLSLKRVSAFDFIETRLLITLIICLGNIKYWWVFIYATILLPFSIFPLSVISSYFYQYTCYSIVITSSRLVISCCFIPKLISPIMSNNLSLELSTSVKTAWRLLNSLFRILVACHNNMMTSRKCWNIFLICTLGLFGSLQVNPIVPLLIAFQINV
jgi:hypothetical protein